MAPPKPTFLEGFMVHNLVFRWPKAVFFMVLGVHGSYMWITITGWRFEICFIFIPKIGEMIQFDEYFSDRLQPPPTCR